MKTPERVLIYEDSRTMATEVGIGQEVCNDLPAEFFSPKNGWR